MSDNKTVLIVGGIAVVAVVIILFLKKQAANQAAYANEPGLESQPGIGAVAQSTGAAALGNIISSLGGGISNWIGGAFSSQSNGSNEPGLESSSEISYPGTNNSALVAQNAYIPGGAIFESPDGTSVPDDFSSSEDFFLDTGIDSSVDSTGGSYYA